MPPCGCGVPNDPATLHFFWLCLAFFGTLTFSFSRLDRLDWYFYWADVVATLLLAPLFLHFTLAFPDRPGAWVRGPGQRLVALLYAPAGLLFVANVIAVGRLSHNTQLYSRVLTVLDQIEPLYLSVFMIAGLVVLTRAMDRVRSATARRQLRWIIWGTAFGAGPFAFGYALPYALGLRVSLPMELSVIPLSLVPLAFASALIRYRLMDVEVIVKRSLVYTAVILAIFTIYATLLRLAGVVFLDAAERHNMIIAMLATIVVVLLFSPVKSAIQNALDRAFYRDRYDYRRALVGFARDLNSDLDLDRLSERLVARIRETFVIDRMALLLVDEASGDYEVIRAEGFGDLAVSGLSRHSQIAASLAGGMALSLDDPRLHGAFPAEELAFWRLRGVHYFVPCVSKGGTIAVLALGQRGQGEPLSSEDMGLLSAVGSHVATALENGRLYRQLQLKASELQRLQEFNENIVESLDNGLVVEDLNGRDRPMEPGAGRHLRPVGGRGERAQARRGVRRAVRRGAARGAARVAQRRVALPRAARRPCGEGRRAPPREHRDRAAAGAERPVRHVDGRQHHHHRGRHRARAPRRAAADFRQDGVGRPAGRRRRARSEHAADRHLELHADAA